MNDTLVQLGLGGMALTILFAVVKLALNGKRGKLPIVECRAPEHYPLLMDIRDGINRLVSIEETKQRFRKGETQS